MNTYIDKLAPRAMVIGVLLSMLSTNVFALLLAFNYGSVWQLIAVVASLAVATGGAAFVILAMPPKERVFGVLAFVGIVLNVLWAWSAAGLFAAFLLVPCTPLLAYLLRNRKGIKATAPFVVVGSGVALLFLGFLGGAGWGVYFTAIPAALFAIVGNALFLSKGVRQAPTVASATIG